MGIMKSVNVNVWMGFKCECYKSYDIRQYLDDKNCKCWK